MASSEKAQGRIKKNRKRVIVIFIAGAFLAFSFWFAFASLQTKETAVKPIPAASYPLPLQQASKTSVVMDELKAGELAKFLAALDGKSVRYGWKDIRPGEIPWEYHRKTKKNHPLMFVRFGESTGNCVLFMGGVHGDELPTVYLMFRLAHYIQENPDVVKHRCIVIAPLVNPDGYLAGKPTRVNAAGVDVNRNFPTRKWHSDAHRHWQTKGRKNQRYYPGPKAASEQETLFQIALIKRFKPQKIMSVHSPLNFFDYDGPSADLDSFEEWMERMARAANHPVKRFGYYPGSLGNYAGNERNIFILTLELPTSDPALAAEYFSRFKPSFLKFIDLPIAGTPPNTRMVKH
jgi:protein MpaA